MNILTLTPKEGTVLLAVIPKGDRPYLLDLANKQDQQGLFFENNMEFILLPTGKYSIVGLLRDLDEFDAGSIVESTGFPFVGFRNYESDADDYTCATPIKSLHSLIRASGGKETDNLLILKQEV